VSIGRLAVKSNLFPLAEWEGGDLVSVKRIAHPVPVEDYLRPQGRFGHLFRDEQGEIERSFIQAIADENARRLGLRAFTPTWHPSMGAPLATTRLSDAQEGG
jgi:pyruvate ferredoxin oxidoreductase beta subunit